MHSYVEMLAEEAKAAAEKQSLKWKSSDLTALEGAANSLILAEFCEQYPLHVQQRGMCTLVCALVGVLCVIIL